jgi:hypothetical protein
MQEQRLHDDCSAARHNTGLHEIVPPQLGDFARRESPFIVRPGNDSQGTVDIAAIVKMEAHSKHFFEQRYWRLNMLNRFFN